MKQLSLMIAAALCAMTTPTMATPINAFESAIASGTLNGSAYSGQITIRGIGNTDDVTQQFQISKDIGLPVTVTIDGLGIATFTDQIQLVANNGANVVGFGDNALNRAILFADAPIGSYNLLTSFGPVMGGASYSGSLAFATDRGAFIISQSESVTYQAIVGSLAPSAPEPATWIMLMAGLGLAGAALRRRQTTGATLA